MASEVLGVLAFARETQKRRKCGPKKAESPCYGLTGKPFSSVEI